MITENETDEDENKDNSTKYLVMSNVDRSSHHVIRSMEYGEELRRSSRTLVASLNS